jgi:hypothetical protein
MARPRLLYPNYKIVRRSGSRSLYLAWTQDGKSREMSLGTADDAKAARIAAAWTRAEGNCLTSEHREVRRLLQERVHSARERARRLGVPFDIDTAHLIQLWDEGGGRCAISGVPFEVRRFTPGKKDPLRPSLDRIEAGGGYVRGNVRLVCLAVNFFMGDWGEGLLHRIAHGIVSKPPKQAA